MILCWPMDGSPSSASSFFGCVEVKGIVFFPTSSRVSGVFFFFLPNISLFLFIIKSPTLLGFQLVGHLDFYLIDQHFVFLLFSCVEDSDFIC